MTYPIALAILGAVLLVVGVAAILKTKFGEIVAPNWPARVIFTVVGAALLVGSAVIFANERAQQQTTPPGPSTPEAGGAMPSRAEAPGPTSAPLASKSDPEKLIAIIRREQEAEVKKSYSDNNCFTDEDKAKFERERVPDKVAKKLEKDGAFIDVVVAVRALDNTARQNLLERAAGTHKPTWSELGRKGPEGQTDAGQGAERLIAEAVVEKVKELLKKSDSELRKLAP